MKKLFKNLSISVVFLMFVNKPSFATITPYHSVTQTVSFGEIFGFPGVCTLDYFTQRVESVSGSLCEHASINFGRPGKIVIYGNPNTQMNIRLSNKINEGDGISYSALGIYSVQGLADVVIIPDSTQTIDTGSTGNIVIHIGGTLTNTEQQSFSVNYEYTIVDFLEYTEL